MKRKHDTKKLIVIERNIYFYNSSGLLQQTIEPTLKSDVSVNHSRLICEIAGQVFLIIALTHSDLIMFELRISHDLCVLQSRHYFQWYSFYDAIRQRF